jgi:hypothetical protein
LTAVIAVVLRVDDRHALLEVHGVRGFGQGDVVRIGAEAPTEYTATVAPQVRGQVVGDLFVQAVRLGQSVLKERAGVAARQL